MVDYRLFFGKQGNGVYISTLDMNRMMQRALKRSLLPVWYSQGFNPHIYCSFPLPLSLGVYSDYEVMDFRLTEEMPACAVENALRAALPEDFPVKKVDRPRMHVKTIGSATYRFTFETGEKEPAALLEDLFTWPELLMEKFTKKGPREIDLLPLIRHHQITRESETICLDAELIATQENTLSPMLLYDAIKTYCPALAAVRCKINRTAILNQTGEEFV